MKIHYVLKGSHENPCTRATKKTQQQQKTTPATYGFCLDFVDTFVGKCNGAQARRGVRGPPGPTIIIIKEIIRFNNNNNNVLPRWSLDTIAHKNRMYFHDGRTPVAAMVARSALQYESSHILHLFRLTPNCTAT